MADTDTADTRTCACGCGEEFVPTNERHRYKGSTHRKRGWEKGRRRKVAVALAERLLAEALDPKRIQEHLTEIEEEL